MILDVSFDMTLTVGLPKEKLLTPVFLSCSERAGLGGVLHIHCSDLELHIDILYTPSLDLINNAPTSLYSDDLEAAILKEFIDVDMKVFTDS